MSKRNAKPQSTKAIWLFSAIIGMAIALPIVAAMRGGAKVPARNVFPQTTFSVVGPPALRFGELGDSDTKRVLQLDPNEEAFLLLDKTPDELIAMGVERVNLLCGKGLDPGVDYNVEQCLQRLESWIPHVSKEVERHLHHFKSNPEKFEHSENKCRIGYMASSVHFDCHVEYDPRLAPIAATASDAEFGRDSRALFMSGMLIDKPIGGTCGSLPFLYMAVGRRLGYPLKFAITSNHCYLIWDSPTERFNIEVTGGCGFPSDEQLLQLGNQWGPELLRAEGALRPLTAKEEIGFCFGIRAACLVMRGRIEEAICFQNKRNQMFPTPTSSTAVVLLVTSQLNSEYAAPR